MNYEWKAPQPMEIGKGVKETKKFGPRAVTSTDFGRMDFQSQMEWVRNCFITSMSGLQLSTKWIKNLPVGLFLWRWILGPVMLRAEVYMGGMAQQGTFVVTSKPIDSNLIGFLAHPDLSARNSSQRIGNYGLWTNTPAPMGKREYRSIWRRS